MSYSGISATTEDSGTSIAGSLQSIAPTPNEGKNVEQPLDGNNFKLLPVPPASDPLT